MDPFKRELRTRVGTQGFRAMEEVTSNPESDVRFRLPDLRKIKWSRKNRKLLFSPGLITGHLFRTNNRYKCDLITRAPVILYIKVNGFQYVHTRALTEIPWSF